MYWSPRRTIGLHDIVHNEPCEYHRKSYDLLGISIRWLISVELRIFGLYASK